MAFTATRPITNGTATFRRIRHGAACLVALCAVEWAAAAPRPNLGVVDVDLALVLAVDVSPSMSQAEQRAQREGYISAFRQPSLARVLASGPTGRIAVLYLEWAGQRQQSVIIPWTVLSDGRDAIALADALRGQPLTQGVGTSISGALSAAAQLLDRSGMRSTRRVIDLSGDGPNNTGPSVTAVRTALAARGITINGLPIAISRDTATDSFASYGESYLDRYFEQCVIGGPGAFTVGITDAGDFESAIARKLMLEIATRPLPAIPAAYSRPPGFDCASAGERPGR
ncbi:DUF1194 domain-containing protein [bacterium M00.F.Ca.ET.159.01.1.1]|nr:DUF1194 domain-containing protein [bacterium M00.F.Ca.ET.159.01.1.1]TGT83022.1 DUF1194 domain-containing protein [bacterium M00.F.Ca.ET.157.01.1.1]